jgi:hypothetical protein
MIFNEIKYLQLTHGKLEKMVKIVEAKYKEINNESLTFTPLTVEAEQVRMHLAQELIKEDDIPSHIMKEFDNYKKERTDFANKIIMGEIQLPTVTKEDLEKLVPTLEEVIKECTGSVDDYKTDLKNSQNSEEK